MIAVRGESTSSFGARVGGGIDIPVNPHVAIRLLQVEYFLSNIDNTTNNHQNNLLVGAGIAFRWPQKALATSKSTPPATGTIDHPGIVHK
jgi:hypothetical protein